MIEQKRWNIINYENSVLNIVSKYTLNDNEEHSDNESDTWNIDSLKVINEYMSLINYIMSV